VLFQDLADIDGAKFTITKDGFNNEEICILFVDPVRGRSA
jgi:hypothetical protein